MTLAQTPILHGPRHSSGWRRTLRLEPVSFALKSGWSPNPGNKTALKHFYFDGPARFQVHWYAGVPNFVVGNTSTTNHRDALRRLQELVEK